LKETGIHKLEDTESQKTAGELRKGKMCKGSSSKSTAALVNLLAKCAKATNGQAAVLENEKKSEKWGSLVPQKQRAKRQNNQHPKLQHQHQQQQHSSRSSNNNKATGSPETTTTATTHNNSNNNQ